MFGVICETSVSVGRLVGRLGARPSQPAAAARAGWHGPLGDLCWSSPSSVWGVPKHECGCERSYPSNNSKHLLYGRFIDFKLIDITYDEVEVCCHLGLTRSFNPVGVER